MKLATLLILFAGTSAMADSGSCSTFGFCGTTVSLPVFGPGPLTNLGAGSEAVVNASAHVGWALAIPLLGEKIGGKKGKWIAGLSWIALTLVHETFFHAPPNPDPEYASEVRTDLITKIVPTLLVLSF